MSDGNPPPATPPAGNPPAAPPANPPANTPPAAPPSNTLIDPPAGNDPPANVGTWRDDWRVAMSGGDDKLAKRFDRFASPEALAKSWSEAQARISSGQVKQPKPDAANADAMKAWREENGIPDSADKYDLNLGNGLVLGDADKPISESFTKFAHGKDWTPDKVKEGLEWYHAYRQEAAEQRTMRDAEYRKDAEDTLRAEWGQEYRINQGLLKTSLESAGLLDELVGARDASGRLILANPKVVQWLVNEERAKNPIGTVLGGSGSANIDTATSRIKQIEGMMYKDGKENPAYWKDKGIQAEYLRLLEAVETVKSRAA